MNKFQKKIKGLKIKDRPIALKDDESFSLNSVENKKPSFAGFKKPAEIKGAFKTTSYKLFMFGETPSKLDRAVFLAITDIGQNLEKHVLLREWYEFMSNCNKSEMNAWKTPMRKKFA